MGQPDEQESQVQPDYMATFTHFRSSPEPDQRVHPNQQFLSDGDIGYDGNKISDGSPEVIPEATVGETQYVSLEPDTQANQDSMISHVPDTQYDHIEVDTQAADGYTPVPVSKVVPTDKGAQLAINAIPMAIVDKPLLKRPELPTIDNAGSGFKFSVGRPRTQNPAKRPEPKHSNGQPEIKTSSAPVSVLTADSQSGSSRTPAPNTKVAVEQRHSAEEPNPSVLKTHVSINDLEGISSRQDTSTRRDHTRFETSEDLSRMSISIQHDEDLVQQKSHTSGSITTEAFSSAIHQPHISGQETSVQSRSAQEPVVVTERAVQLVSGTAAEPTKHIEVPETNMPSLPQSAPLTPLKSAENAKLSQRRLSRGRRLKKPFPEATTSEDSRRWGEKTAARSATAPVNSVDVTRSGTSSNTGRARYSRDDDMHDNEHGHRQRSVSVAASELVKPIQQHGTGSYAPTTSIALPPGETSNLPSHSAQIKLGNGNQTSFNTTARTDPRAATLRPEHDLHSDRVTHHAMALDHPTLPAVAIREEYEGLAIQQTTNADDPRGDSDRHSVGASQNSRVVRQPILLDGDNLQNIFEHPSARLEYQATSETQSRPQSRRSDRPKQVSRPLSSRDLRADNPAMLQATHANKVRKTSKSNKQNAPVDRPQSSESQLGTELPVNVIMQMHRQSGDGLCGVVQKLQATVTSQESSLEEYKACITSQNAEIDEQKSRIKFQDAELERLRISSEKSLGELRQENTKSKKIIQDLEQKHEALSQTQQKLKEQAKKYAIHMNDVVNAQKWCKAKAEVIRKQTSDAIASCAKEERALARVESARANLQSAVKDSKEVHLTIQKLETVSKEKQELIAVNNRLLADKEKHMKDVKAFEMQLQEVQSQHETEKASLVSEKDTLHTNAENVLKNFQLLQSELDDRLKDLSAERHQNEQLRKNLSDQTTSWGQLLELVKQVPTDTTELINAEDGKVATLLNSEHTTHQKLEEMTTMIKELAMREQELPPTLVKLIEDISLRLEGEKQLSDGNNNVLRDTAATISQELKDGLNQLRLDKEAEIRFNTKISELEQVCENLKAQKVASDAKVENLSRQLEESRQELSTCRSDLSNKNNELSALTVPREDPALRIKISELEEAKTALDNQAKEARQELSRANEELVSVQQVLFSKEEDNNTLTQRLSNMQQSLKNCDQDKAKALALQEEELDNRFQGIAKNMETQKSTIKVKLEAEVKALELRVTERNAEIDSLKEEIRIAQSEARKHNTAAEADAATYKHQFLQLVGQLKRLEQESCNQNTSRISDELKSAQKELAGIRTLFQSATADTARSLEVATREQKAIEETLCKIDGAQGGTLTTSEGSGAFKFSALPRPSVSTENPARPQAAAHVVPQQHPGEESRALRSAPRKTNWKGASLNPENRSSISTPQSGKRQESTKSNTSASVTPAEPQSSPLSDLSPLFADSGSARTQLHSRKSYDPQSHPIGDMHDDIHQPGGQVKSRPNVPSTTEESHRRRTSMPPKSAMKKSTRSNPSLSEAGTAGAGQDGTIRMGTKNGSMEPPPTKNRPLIDNFQGVVSGSSARATTSNRSQPSTTLAPGTPGSSHFFDVQNSPPMDAPKRNRSKRVASTALESPKPKAPRLGVSNRFSARTEIPDSQADSQDSTYY